MRVTNSMLLSNYLKNLNRNLDSVGDMQQQMATGKRINKISDDPIGAISVMQMRAKLYKTEQYSKNVDKALSWLDETESSVLELNEVLKSAYDTAVAQSSGTMNAQSKAAAAELIKQLRDHVVSIGNSKSGDKYIFGGYNVTNAPFEVDASGNILYNGIDLTNDSDPALIAMAEDSVSYSVGFNITLDISINGAKLFGTGENNIYTILDDFYQALESDASTDELGVFITKIQNAQSSVLAVDSEIGGKTNRLELIQSRFEDDVLTYTERKSKLEDVDEAEAIMNYKMAETVYEASLQIGSQIVQLSLVDFLK